MKPRKNTLSLNSIFIIIVVAFIIRIWGINHRFPDVNRFFYETEEYPSLQIAMGFGTGDLNPHSFNKPSLYYYLLFGLYGFFYIFGKILGLFGNIADFVKFYFYHTWVFYLIGRVLSTVFGIGSIYLIYLTGRKIFNTKVGLITAGLLAVIPIHVEFSQLALPDMLGLFLAIIATYYFLATYIDFCLKNIILGSLFAGLAMSAKYYYGFVIFGLFIVIAIHVIKEKSFDYSHFKKAFIGISLFLIAFIIGTPFALLDYKYFVSSFVELRNAKSELGILLYQKGLVPNWWIDHIFKLGDKNVLGIGLLVISLLGIIFAILQHSFKDIILVPLIIFFYSFFSISRWIWSPVHYLLLIIPYLLLLGSDFIVNFTSKFKLNKWLQVFILSSILLPPFITVCINDNLNSHLDTKAIAKIWIENNLPKNSKILMDKIYGPQLSLTESSLNRFLDNQSPNVSKLLPSYRKFESKNKYVYLRDESLTKRGVPFDIYLIDSNTLFNIQEYKEKNINYIILSSQAIDAYLNNPPFNIHKNKRIEFYNAVREQCAFLKSFKPNTFNLPGPEIEIYQVN